MPLSATFGFFSPFHSKKKLICQSFSIFTHLFLLFFLFFSPLISVKLNSAPIFVILLLHY